MTEHDCLFCRIIRGEIPCSRLLETARFLAFLDIGPVNPGHSLLVPKAHHATVLDMPAELGAELLEATRQLGQAVMQSTGAAGFNVVQNNFPAAGQVVEHVHWHVIPRFDGDGRLHWHAGSCPDQESMRELAERIRAAL